MTESAVLSIDLIVGNEGVVLAGESLDVQSRFTLSIGESRLHNLTVRKRLKIPLQILKVIGRRFNRQNLPAFPDKGAKDKREITDVCPDIDNGISRANNLLKGLNRSELPILAVEPVTPMSVAVKEE